MVKLNTSLSANAQPRLARVASAIGDPSRANMLALLMDGRMYTASELAHHASVTPPTASAHLKLLLDEGLTQVTPRGRHRYFSLANGDVARAIEALLYVADGVTRPDEARWQRPAMRALRYCRSCYGHLAGEIGVWLCQSMKQQGWIAVDSNAVNQYVLTELGLLRLADWGCKQPAQSRGLYSCVDWSERREHLAGKQAVDVLDRLLLMGWLQRAESSRALSITALGHQHLTKVFSCTPPKR